jgi:hypothetical protein
LLEWAPTILVSDNMVDKVLTWGIRIDAIVGEQNVLTSVENSLRGQQQVDFLVASRGQSIARAADYLANRNQHHMTVITGNFDEIRRAVEEQLQKVGIVVQDKDVRWIPLRGKLSKWVNKDAKFIIREAPHRDVRIAGLRPVGDHCVTDTEGMISISSLELIWVGEFL